MDIWEDMPASLLVVACSQRKRLDPGLLPAIQRYDGPIYRVLRRYLDGQPAGIPDVYVLSAEYGLCPHTFPIPYYDRRMTRPRAQELQPLVHRQLSRILAVSQYRRAFICVGRDYLRVLEGYDFAASPLPGVQVAKGSMGRRLSELHDWLHGAPPASSTGTTAASTPGAARIRGIEVAVAREQVLDVARRASTRARPGAAAYQSWYVPVDGQRIAPKWLVSQLTGLPVSTFATDEARRVLAQLGIEVMRV